MLSKFLPPDFDPSATIALIAGKGAYPKVLAKKLASFGVKTKLAAFEDETDADLLDSFADGDKAVMNIGQLGKLLKTVKNFGAKYAIMAGQITPKKLFKGLKPDLKALSVLLTLKERNAETIFGAIAAQLSKIGCELLDARSFLDEYIAPKGFFCGKKWSVKPEHLEHAMRIARELARLDVGQSCVASKGSILAAEAFEGTDKMIERAGTFEAADSLFAKTVKPDQDYRFDVPVIGERTLRKLAAANIKNVAVESGSVIILEPEKVRALAEQNGIKIFGV
ncbi:MAG: UDP-2,3-diacylglucosamine diphosphatase LpxI [Opitutales bacterium]|nr:UDP-2,3-diacylglucosamine diphosphatase LpxI [Opitutales bacterium]